MGLGDVPPADRVPEPRPRTSGRHDVFPPPPSATGGAMSSEVEESGGLSDIGDIDDMGPVDYVVIEFPGNRMTGNGLPMLVDLVDRGIIRIFDLVFVRKDLDGS